LLYNLHNHDADYVSTIQSTIALLHTAANYRIIPSKRSERAF